MTSLETRDGHCPHCGDAMAHDQRYCLACGARRGPLPTRIALRIGELHERGRRGNRTDAQLAAAAAASGASGATRADPDGADDRLGDLIPAARSAAVALLLMLGFGCVIGAATAPGGVESLAHTIVVAVSPGSHPASTTMASSGGGGSGAGGGSSRGGTVSGGGVQARRTITVTTPGPAAAPTPAAPTVTPPSSPSAGGGGGGPGGGSGGGPTTANALPPIGHVFEIVLSGQSYQQSFATTTGHPYLSSTLKSQGELIPNYDAVAGSPLANEIALISGQGPTPQTLGDCPTFSEITPATTGKDAQVLGDGCLYPSTTQTLGDQLAIAGLRWRAYVQGVGEPGQTHPTSTSTTTTGTDTTTATTPTTTSATTTSTTSTTTITTTPGSSTTGGGVATPPITDTSTASACPHPAAGATDAAHAPAANDDYVTWKNPFVYFHSLLDGTRCAADDVGLGQLAADLKQESTTPALSYIAPDPCDDGSDQPCRPGAKAGLGQADRFLHQVVPAIERSPAYRDNGMIVITFDDAPQSGPSSSTASCCDQPAFPNLPSTTTTTGTAAPTTRAPTTPTDTTGTAPSTTGCSTTGTATATTPTTSPTTTTTTGATTTSTGAACAPSIVGDPPGGGQVGLLLISPYVTPDTVDVVDVLNHFSLLASVEKLFHLPALGYGADPALPMFSPSLFTSTKG